MQSQNPQQSMYSYQQQAPSQQQPNNFVPKRMAPTPPVPSTSYDPYNDSPRDRNGHVVEFGAGGHDAAPNKRDSFGAGAARSSYQPGSRPPYSTTPSSNGSYQPSRAPPQPPNSARTPGGFGPSSSNPSTPTRRPSIGAPLPHPPSSGLGGSWELVDDAPFAPPKRPAPPTVTNSLRELADALPPSTGSSNSSRGLGGYPSSANSSNSSLVVHPPSNNTQPLQTQHGSGMNHASGHHPTQSLAQSYSLLTDPATAAAAGLAADVGPTPGGGERPRSLVAAGGGGGGWGAAANARPISNSGLQHQGVPQRSSNDWAASHDSSSGSGSGSQLTSTNNVKEGKEGKGEKGSRVKGVLGSFLSTFFKAVECGLGWKGADDNVSCRRRCLLRTEQKDGDLDTLRPRALDACWIQRLHRRVHCAF